MSRATGIQPFRGMDTVKDTRTENLLERRSEPRRQPDSYHSVELSIDGLEFSYQFKLHNIASRSMCVIVKEDSEILPRLKVGDTLNMKFYSQGSPYPSEDLATAIRHITKNESGRLRGHYLIGLEIIE
ncbi:MAG: hypothetical protein JRH06_03280 [Deltaproteobacteria bacterium]|nr:hypothetical protein [Deltaproteobacteria bacterium]